MSNTDIETKKKGRPPKYPSGMSNYQRYREYYKSQSIVFYSRHKERILEKRHTVNREKILKKQRFLQLCQKIEKKLCRIWLKKGLVKYSDLNFTIRSRFNEQQMKNRRKLRVKLNKILLLKSLQIQSQTNL